MTHGESARRQPSRRRFFLVLAILLIGAAALVSSVPALADSGPTIPIVPALLEQGEPENGPRLGQGAMAPFQMASKLFSGRVWLLASGMEPALGLSKDDALKLGGSATPPAQGGGGGAALVPYRDPSAKFSRNILLSEDFGQFSFQTEPHVAVNPKDPNNILVGLIDYNFPTMVTYSSIDGGATWQGPVLAKYPRQDLGSAGDPVVGFDRQGNSFYGYISLDAEEFRIGPVVGEAVVSSIAVSRSKDAGLTWSDPATASRSAIRARVLGVEGTKVRGEVDFGFLDKPWMVIGPNPKDKSKDIIYVSYTKFVSRYQLFWVDELPFLGSPVLETVIEVTRSEDGGATWSKPAEVSPRALYIISSNAITSPPSVQEQVAESVRRVVQGSALAVAPDGTAYVAWMDSTRDSSFEGVGEIYIARSEDGGATFSRPQLASSFLESGFRPRTSNFRYWSSSFPRLATGPKGEVYLLYGAVPATNPEDDGDVFFLRSTDKGRTWTRRKRVNDDEADRLQFFAELTTAPNGTLHAMWADMRDDPEQVSYHIYYASSEDGGATWSVNSRVSDFPTNPNRAFPSGRFIGDYFGIAATNDDVYMVWADGRLGEFGSANQKIGFARKRLMPTPTIFISPPRGPAGKDIVIQGFNFQPQRDIFIEVAGAIVSTTRANREGRFSAGIFVPISGEGAHVVRAIDASGNLASGSFFMDFGFDNIQKTTDRIDAVAEQLKSLQQGLETGSGQPSASLTAELQAIQKALEELKTTQGDSEETSLWPLLAVVVIALPLALALGIFAMLLRRQRRPTP